jgi:hypothetical protein
MENLETGDIILFHSKNTIFGRLIQFFSGSNYCHIGMVIKDPLFTEYKLMGLYLWESSLEKFPDAVDHKIKFGVEIVGLEEIITNNINQDDMYYRKLNVNNRGNIFTQEKLREIYKIVKDKPYDIMPQDWIEALFREDSDPQKTDRFWCSALLGYIFTKLELLPENTDWSILRPGDFSSEGSLPLLQGAYFDLEKNI